MQRKTTIWKVVESICICGFGLDAEATGRAIANVQGMALPPQGSAYKRLREVTNLVRAEIARG